MVALLLIAQLLTASAIPVSKSCDALPSTLRVRITIGSSKWKPIEPTIRQLVEETWRPAGLRIEWLPDGAPKETVDFRIAVVHGLNTTAQGGALGMVQFDAGRPQPMARVSIDAAVLLARQYQARLLRVPIHLVRFAEFENPEIVARLLGYAAAHETGHFALATKTHADSGLMRATYRELTAMSDETTWRLDRGNHERLQQRLGSCGSKAQ